MKILGLVLGFLFVAACAPMSVKTDASDTTRVYISDQSYGNDGLVRLIIEEELMKYHYALVTDDYGADFELVTSSEIVRLAGAHKFVLRLQWMTLPGGRSGRLITVSESYKPWDRGGFEKAVRRAVATGLSTRD